MHSQRMSEKPLAPWLIAEKGGKVIAAHCDCMAGLGETCSHAAALMFYIDAAVRIRDSRTVTQEKAYWMLPATVKSVEYSAIAKINFQSSKSKRQKLKSQIENLDSPGCTSLPRAPRVKRVTSNTPSPSSESITAFYLDLSKCNIKPAILSLVSPYSDDYIPKPVSPNFPALLTDLYNVECTSMQFSELLAFCANVHIEIKKEEANHVDEATRDQTWNNLWFQYRAGRITASRFKSACHTNPGLPSQSLIKAICYPGTSRFTSAATVWGCNHEKMARDQYLRIMIKKHTEFEISECGFVIDTTYPFIGATPDGLISCKCCGKGCLEIKCPYCIRNKILESGISGLSWFKPVEQGQLQQNKTHSYYYQVQCQMHRCSLAFSDFVVWTETDIHIEGIEYDENFMKENIKRVSEFFKQCILPELIGKFYSRAPLSVRSAAENNEHVEEIDVVLLQETG